MNLHLSILIITCSTVVSGCVYESDDRKNPEPSNNRVTAQLDDTFNSSPVNVKEEKLTIPLDSGIAGFYIGYVQQKNADQLPNPALNGNSQSDLEYTCLLNRDSTQLLRMRTHPGDARGSFAEFELRWIRKGENLKNFYPSPYSTFQTTLGIQLGDSLSKVEESLISLSPSKEKISSYICVLRCRAEGMDKYRYLYSHNMPIYFANYKFENEIIISLHFGFEYP